ncbi:MAG TPA: sigma factor-like helix-turn-helix DNA-binding protein [Vicinamibacteria bacterium]|nr:sigma factor-like helix-turn-helix DNA-binding protein [Vicinamibacteria bacterium]
MGDPTTLEDALHGAYDEGRRAHPDLPLDLARFAAHLRPHAPEGDLSAWAGALRAADVYLAAACVAGVPEAIRRFEEQAVPSARAALRGLRLDPAAIDDVLQRLRTHLLVAREGRPAKLTSYAGKGSLAGWVRVVALRMGLEDRSGTHPGLEAVAEPVGSDPEIAYLRGHYGPAFRAAVQDALAVLSERERLILCLHLGEQASLEDIGRIYAVNKSTVSRWMAQARSRIQDEVKRLLHERLRVRDAEVDSLYRLVQSDLHVSLVRLLRHPPA